MKKSGRYKHKEILVTGGLGFIGSNLAIALVEEGASVTLVDSMVPDYGGNLFNVEGIKGSVHINFSDLRDKYSVAHLVKGKDYIFNLAGQVSHIDSMLDPQVDLEINAQSQLSLLEACRKNNPEVKIIYTSTRQVYGRPEYLPVDEKHPLNPVDVNGINKMAGEQYHVMYDKVYGIRSCILRLTNTYGPRQLVKHNRQGFIGWFIRSIVRGEKVQIFGDGTQLRDLNFVDDVVRALLDAGYTPAAYGQIMNLGMDVPVSLKGLVELMIKVNGGGQYKLVEFPEEKKRIDIGSIYTDYKKIKSIVGWEPVTKLEEGLRCSFEYYKKYGDRYWE